MLIHKSLVFPLHCSHSCPLSDRSRATASISDAAADFSVAQNPNGVWSYALHSAIRQFR